jgi:hypothetical protein
MAQVVEQTLVPQEEGGGEGLVKEEKEEKEMRQNSNPL